MSSSPNNDNNNNNNDNNNDTLLVVGSCGMDRLLSVWEYPKADAKVRTTAYTQVGGGNAANTAHAVGLLLSPLNKGGGGLQKVQLATKLGNDDIGQALQRELQQANVALDSPLFAVNNNNSPSTQTTTAFTTVIVSQSEQTRTCIHTPGTCGEWTRDEIQTLLNNNNNKNNFWNRIRHVHSDARHTDAALELVQQAQQQQQRNQHNVGKQQTIGLSLDVEKDRQTPALDQLLVEVDLVFTNGGPALQTYIQRLTTDRETETGRRLLQPANVHAKIENDNNNTTSPSSTMNHNQLVYLTTLLRTSCYLTRWFAHNKGLKQVVVTQGSRGSVHIQCQSVQRTVVDLEPMNIANGSNNEFYVSKKTMATFVPNVDVFDVVHEFVEFEEKTHTHWRVEAKYTLHTTGVLQNVADKIVDTTGCGDAFIGGYLWALYSSLMMVPTTTTETTMTRVSSSSTSILLKFAAWVAGCKLQGPGARTGLPSVEQVHQQLGTNRDEIIQSLDNIIGPFDYNVV